MDVAGILLTGGASSRMGCDKATLVVHCGGETLARRTARLLRTVAHPCVEVGPGRSGLPSVQEIPRGAGPLAAVARGWEALLADGARCPVLVVATDLPALDIGTLQWLATGSPPGSVVPVIDGYPQPLCARWSPADLDQARWLVAQEQRAMRSLLERCQPVLVEREQGPFSDADTPEQARLLGLTIPGAVPAAATAPATAPQVSSG